MKAGPDMDALVARGMGWELNDERFWMLNDRFLAHLDEWHPHRNIADAWRVVEYLRSQGWSVKVVVEGDASLYRRAGCELYGWLRPYGCGDSAPEAICRAFLDLREKEKRYGESEE